MRFNYDAAVAEAKHEHAMKMETLNHKIDERNHEHEQRMDQLAKGLRYNLYELDTKLNNTESSLKWYENEIDMIEKYGTALPDDYFDYNDD